MKGYEMTYLDRMMIEVLKSINSIIDHDMASVVPILYPQYEKLDIIHRSLCRAIKLPFDIDKAKTKNAKLSIALFEAQEKLGTERERIAKSMRRIKNLLSQPTDRTCSISIEAYGEIREKILAEVREVS